MAPDLSHTPNSELQRLRVIDSHTGGEPTRVIVSGGPDLAGVTMHEQREDFRQRFDHFRRAVVDEPRGSDIWIGALLCESKEPDCVAGMIFFNTESYLGMCGHGTIGFVKTLEYMGRITQGTYHLETPVGKIRVELKEDGRVALRNVPVYRHLANVRIEVDQCGTVGGDVVWGGNWFFLAKTLQVPIDRSRVDELLSLTKRIRRALVGAGVFGGDGSEIDHIELFGEPADEANDSRSFVLCPGGSYDRSPCGTGTSAKLACLAEDGLLQPGEIYRQESVIGSTFEAYYELEGEQILPTIIGSAHVMGEGDLIMHPEDPFAWGITE